MTEDVMAAYAEGEQIKFDMEWYDKLRASRPNWKFVKKATVEPNNGQAIYVKKGQTIKFVQTSGSNVCDVHFFGADIKDTTGEHYNIMYTAGIEGFVLKENARIWSSAPFFRPMATYIEDNIDPSLLPGDEYSAVWHGAHCFPEAIELAYGVINHHACQANFLEAAERVGLDYFVAALPNVNLFQPMTIMPAKSPTGSTTVKWHAAPFYAPPGTFIEFYAEIDLLILASHCPYGNQSDTPMKVEHHPIDIEIWDTGTQPLPSPKWHDWRAAHKKKLERLKEEGDKGPRSRTFD